MSFDLIGTDYGGWMINTDLVPPGSTIISAGVGEDISFDNFLIKKKNCQVIGIDPTPKSHNFIEKLNPMNNFVLIKKALSAVNDDLVEIYRNKNPDHVSESILSKHQAVKNYDYYYSETVSLNFLLEKYKNVSVIKMDVEGSEYEIIDNLKEVPETVRQICVEFHHFCSNKTIEDTYRCIEKLKSLGFENYVEKQSHHKLSEVTFWR